ncbi:MAG TPA: transketolase [Anaerolineales bacterium]|nr:transketolase [Anaerolineales bacterium]
MKDSLPKKAIQTIRFLSADAVQKANSGHPGLPMGAAAMAYVLWTRHLKHNPRNPRWFNRDRFVLSGGHGSMLLYSLLHLSGYDLPIEEIANFRQWGSKTPGHPEYPHTPGVEVTTGPLGQGFANGVGLAIAEAHLAAQFNREGYDLVDHRTYAIVTDGDLMEGVASEAASLAGYLELGKLIYLYDDNEISIDGSTDLTFTEDVAARFNAYGWQTLQVPDGNDLEAVDAAIEAAKADPRPSLIVCRTVIGFGLPTRAGTAAAHGEPPGEAELDGAKRDAGWPLEPRFLVPDDVRDHFNSAVDRGGKLEADWQESLGAYREAFPELGAEFRRRMYGELPDGWGEGLVEFPADKKGNATRNASGAVLNELAGRLPELMGGSADLTGSNKTWLKGEPPFSKLHPEGRNFHFGVREHGMGAIANGMAVHGGLIPYVATFLVFSDYMRPAIRLSALSGYPVIWVFTHDSIGLGEDGPTHQPVEHLAALRAIPNLVVIRPADGNETREAWRVAIERRSGPTALALTRQNVPELDRAVFNPADGLARGAYILADLGDEAPEVILMASGSEVGLIVESGFNLVAEGLNVRLVSFPSWELFEAQDVAYRDTVLPPHILSRIAVEAGVSQGWTHWVGPKGLVIGVDRFGASAPYETIYEKFGLSIEAITKKIQRLVRDNQVDDLSALGRYSWMQGGE